MGGTHEKEITHRRAGIGAHGGSRLPRGICACLGGRGSGRGGRRCRCGAPSGLDGRRSQRGAAPPQKWGYYSGSVDGIFGSGTKKAVISFQKKNGLTADGVVGKATYKALGMTDSYNALVNGGSSGGASSSDLYLLAKTIYAEGRGEPYTGQVAIGAVILNRVKSSSFPNTVAGVVYQPGRSRRSRTGRSI